MGIFYKIEILILGNNWLANYSEWVYNHDVLKMSNSNGGDILKYPNIEAERARKGLSAEALAEALGVSRKTIYNWMNNGNIPQSALKRMSILFDCSADYLLSKNNTKEVK